MFSVQTPVALNAEDQADNQITFPGQINKTISLADLGIDNMTDFTLFFDRIGRPYTGYTDEDTNSPLGDPGQPITISAGGQTRNITVIPETGLTQ